MEKITQSKEIEKNNQTAEASTSNIDNVIDKCAGLKDSIKKNKILLQSVGVAQELNIDSNYINFEDIKKIKKNKKK